MKIFSKKFTLFWLLLGILVVWFFAKDNNTIQNVEEKVLATVSPVQVKGLDPAQVGDRYSATEVAKVYEGLLEYHYLKRPLTLAPNLAAAMPTVSEDGLTYTFKLKQGVKFHDNACFSNGKGRELTAEDFVYTIKRVADPKLNAPIFYLLAEKIQGLDAWRKKQVDAPKVDYTAAIAGVKAIDTYTLQFTLNKPYPSFLYALAVPTCYVVPQEAVVYYGEEFLNHPVGTGPFTLKAYTPQANKLVYLKNPNFRVKKYPNEASESYKHLLADAGKQLPLVDKVVRISFLKSNPDG